MKGMCLDEVKRYLLRKEAKIVLIVMILLTNIYRTNIITRQKNMLECFHPNVLVIIEMLVFLKVKQQQMVKRASYFGIDDLGVA